MGTLSSLPPGTRDVAARDSGDKRVQGKEPDIVNGSILQLNCASICSLFAGVILICYTVLTSLKKGETAVHGCNPTLSVSVVLVSRKVNFLRSISLAVFVFPKVGCSSGSISPGSVSH